MDISGDQRTRALRRAGGTFPSFRCIRFGELPQEAGGKYNQTCKSEMGGAGSNRLVESDAPRQGHGQEQFTT